MTFPETGLQPDSPLSPSLPELQADLECIDQERCGLCQSVEAQWPDIPHEAISYLASNCPKPELMSAALSEMQHLLREDPSVLDDPELLPFLIDDCIATAGDNASSALEAATKATANNLDTTAAVLIQMNAATAKLGGREKLAAANAFLNNPDIPEGVRQALSVRFAQIAKTLDQMGVVFTDDASQIEFQAIVASSSFELGATNMAVTFAPILKQIETSDKFTDEQKVRLRQVVTGSDAQRILRGTITDEDGTVRPRYSQRRQRELRTGVSGYSAGSRRQMIEARAGDHVVTKDVTGWSGEDVGFLIETMHMWNTLEGFGMTGFVENIYKIDFSILGNGSAFDPMQITRMRQVLSHLVGGFEGYDGDIADLADKKTLLQNQARLLSDTQTAFGWENDQAGTQNVLQRLGLQDEKGNPNLDIIQAFGDYTQRNSGTGAPDQMQVTQYLHRLYPAFVKQPSDPQGLS